MAEIMRFLDAMDATREVRTMGRPGIRTYEGYRAEWYEYEDEWFDDNAER